MSAPNLRPAANDISVGTFIKTPAPQIVELLGLSGLDFGVIDAEHAALDRGMIDLMLLAGRAARLPLMVRVSTVAVEPVQTALDSGAAGILAPHIDTVEQARAFVAKARFRGGQRGFSSSTRAAGYGAQPMAQALDAGDSALLICQIETPEAVQAAEAIAALDGVDGLFVGRADLAVAMGETSAGAKPVMEAAAHVSRVARAKGKIAGMATGDGGECAAFRAMGVNWFIVGADQSFLRAAAQRAVAAARQGETP